MRKSKIIENQKEYINELLIEIDNLKNRIATKDELIKKLVKAI